MPNPRSPPRSSEEETEIGENYMAVDDPIQSPVPASPQNCSQCDIGLTTVENLKVQNEALVKGTEHLRHPCLTHPRKFIPHNPHWENLAWGLCGELPTRQNLVWGAPRQPHTKCTLFFRPHAIPTQSPPILMYICDPHAF